MNCVKNYIKGYIKNDIEDYTGKEINNNTKKSNGMKKLYQRELHRKVIVLWKIYMN